MMSSTDCAGEKLKLPAFPLANLPSLLREPLLHFLLLGLALYLAVSFVEAQSARYRIAIGADQIERMKLTYAQQFGDMPTSGQLEELMNRYIREEISFREGLALGLDRDDEIVRRRVAQKFEFLQQDLAAPQEPSPAALKAYFDQHAARYAEPARVSFSQIYFSPDRAGDAEARARALAVGARADEAGHPEALGDSFPGQSEIAGLSAEELSRLFGRSEIVERAFAAPLGVWSGPYRSGYGWHLLRVTARVPRTLPPFERVRDKVAADYREDRRRAQDASAYAELRRKYRISIEERAP
jgi:peptidyl-prolyl cis-trans isomerase C